jgi:hypothetical protein
MLAASSGVLIALALAASPARPPLLVAHATPRPDALVIAALPPAPENVTLTTRMFGTVDVPHKTHLDLRIKCKSCHGSGPVGKIDFETPKVAHDACVGCHKAEQAGPTGCRDCHAVPNKPDASAIAASQSPEPPLVDVPTANPRAEVAVTTAAAAGAQPAPASTLGANAVATPVPVSSSLPPPPPPPALANESSAAPSAPIMARPRRLEDAGFTRSVEVGFITLSEPGQGLVVGPALNVKAQDGRAVFVHSLASAGGSKRGHTLALLGGGLVTRVADGWNVSAMGLGGLDAAYRTTQLFPALGLRLDVDWAARGARVFQAFSLSFTFVADVTRPRDEFGERVGGVLYGVTLTGAMRKGR